MGCHTVAGCPHLAPAHWSARAIARSAHHWPCPWRDAVSQTSRVIRHCPKRRSTCRVSSAPSSSAADRPAMAGAGPRLINPNQDGCVSKGALRYEAEALRYGAQRRLPRARSSGSVCILRCVSVNHHRAARLPGNLGIRILDGILAVDSDNSPCIPFVGAGRVHAYKMGYNPRPPKTSKFPNLRR